jgi:valyl-tRNA synthetase
MLTGLARLVDESTGQLEAYDYARVLERRRAFFWSFCDDYLELVKSRRYGDFGPRRRPAPTARCWWRCRRCCGCSRRTCPS